MKRDFYVSKVGSASTAHISESRSIEEKLEDIDGLEIRCVMDKLENALALEELNLGACGIDWMGAKSLSDILKADTSIAVLELYGNAIGSKGAQYLSEALKHNNKLKALDLGDNALGLWGMQCLSEMLRCNTSLVVLRLYNNDIGGALGALYLSKALKTNTSLKVLDLYNTNIGLQGVNYLLEALQFNTRLVGMNVNNENCSLQGDEMWSKISKILYMNNRMRTFPSAAFYAWAAHNVDGLIELASCLDINNIVHHNDTEQSKMTVCIPLEIRQMLEKYYCACKVRTGEEHIESSVLGRRY